MSTRKSVNLEPLLYTNTISEWSMDKPEGKSQHCNIPKKSQVRIFMALGWQTPVGALKPGV